MRWKISFILIAILAFKGIAEIDPSTGSFTLEHTDLKTNEALTPLEIKRYYNHKIKSNGIFGKNWCSNLDERVTHKKAVILITKCGQPTGLIFSKVADYFATATGAEVVKELPAKSGYIRITTNRVYSYNEKGQLAAIAIKKSFAEPYVRIYFNKLGLISKIVHNDKYHYIFKYEPVEKSVVSITGPGGLNLVYTYIGNSYLASATSVWKKTIRYSYDKSNRLTQFGVAGSNNLVEYDAQNFVNTIKDAGGCVSKLQYKMSMASQHLETTIENSCGQGLNYATNKSPVFLKNRQKISQLSRVPASISPLIADVKIGWKNVMEAGHQWDYFENKTGLISEVRYSDLGTKKIQKLKLIYDQQRISEISLDDGGGIYFIYRNDVFADMLYLDRADKSNETLGLYARFISVVARNINVK